MRILLTIALYGVLAGLIATRPRADDIDIYLAASGPEYGPARVMLAIDMRAEAADIVCADATADECKSALGDELYSELDLFGFNAETGSRGVLEHSADGVADLVQADPGGGSVSMAGSHWAGVGVDRYDVLRAALRVVLTRLGNSLRGAMFSRRVEVGLIALHADDCAGAGPRFSPNYDVTPVAGCSQGAYILQGLTDISDPAGLDELLLALAALPDPGRRAPWMAARWPGHPYKVRDIYLELHRYLTGQAVFNGFLGSADFGSRLSGNLYHTRTSDVINDVLLSRPGGATGQPLLAPALDILLPSSFDLARNNISGAQYLSPIGPQESCASVAMVNLQLGAAYQSHRETISAIAALPAAGGLGLHLAPGASGDRVLVAEMAAGLPDLPAGGSRAAVPVHSYFYSLAHGAPNEAMAISGDNGSARSLAEPREFVEALAAIFAEVEVQSSSLVAASTLVNDTRRHGSGRDIYFALFQPDQGPLWPGNLKKLKIVGAARASSDPGVGDVSQREIIAQAPLTATPTPAVSAEDGKILPGALTFWTDPEGLDVLAFDATRHEVSGRDGRSVTRGGAGQQITGFLASAVGAANSEQGARQFYTLDPEEPGNLLALDATAATLTALTPYLDPGGDMNEPEELNLIRWIRGQDSFDADGDGDRLESRRWLLGAPLHSRPLAISYGARAGTSHTAQNPDVRIFFGTNDGVFHVVRNTSASAAESGRETWAFIPPELLGMQSALARNRVSVNGYQPYGLDGEPVSIIRDVDRDGDIEIDEGDSVWVFIGQRRGGRRIYAFDVTDPDSPRHMWSLDNTSPGFEQLALTFSTPRLARLDLGESAPTTALVFAGGYNGGWSGNERVGKDAGPEADFIGNAIYVVDPENGSLIWRAVGPDGGRAHVSDERLLHVAGLVHSIPSPLTVIDVDRNGIDDRAYVGDSGGNVWRVEFTEHPHRQPDTAVTAPSNWRVTMLASLGGAGDADRRFFHAADVVQSRDSAGEYVGVVLLSGNRAAPRETEVRNFAYLLKDRMTAAPDGDPSVSKIAAMGHNQLTDVTELCTFDSATACDGAELASGWKLGLRAAGEKGLSTPLVSNGRILFTSYVPLAEDPLDESPQSGSRSCRAYGGSGRVYAIRLKNGSPALSKSTKIKFRQGDENEDEGAQATRFLSIGPGLPGDVVPVGEGVLIPGTGLEAGSLVSVPGQTWWRAYWREEEADTL